MTTRRTGRRPEEIPAPEVAIVGMAAVFPGAADLAGFWSNIVGGVDAITDVPASRWGPEFYDPDEAARRPGDRMYCRRGGFVADRQFDPMRFGIMPNAASDIEPDQLIALQVAADAIADAGGADSLGEPARVATIIGRGGYLTAGMARFVDRVRTANQLGVTLRELLPDLDDDRIEAVRAAFVDRLGPLREESGIDQMVPNLVASRLANRLDLGGPAYTVDAACASSLVAVDHGVRELVTGRCDAVLAGGVHHCHDITFWSGFNLLGALSRTGRSRPFHRDADGLLIGEGTGIVVLKRLAEVGDGERVYAVIRGTGVASDGRSTSLMNPRSEGQVSAMRQAWSAAGLDPVEPGSIGLLEAHGTATVAGDGTELHSLTEVFGPAGSRGPDIGIGSVKSMIGHTMPAAGAAGLIKATLALHHGVRPPTLHCDAPHPQLAGARFRPVTGAEDWPDERGRVRRAAVNAFGFGGVNAHVLLSAPEPARTRRATVPAAPRGGPGGSGGSGEPVLRLAGAEAGDLAAALDRSDEALLARAREAADPGPGPVRLGIVAPTAKRLALARKIVAQGRAWRGRSDVWFTTEPLLGGARPGRVAFLFPGLEQTFQPRVDDVAEHFGLPAVELGDAASLGRRGLDLVGVGRLLEGALRRLGVRPDVMAGHSIGEWSALVAAGVAPFEEFAASTRTFDSGPGVPDLAFAALGCGAERAAGALTGLDQVVVSHDNCPHQSIICGPIDGVRAALTRLGADGVTGQVLPFRSGFHTPMLEPYLGPTRAFIGEVSLGRPRVPVWSATTVAPYPEPVEAVRELLVRNLVEPVRFGPLVRALHDAGVRAFVQVGTGSLPGFVADSLEAADAEHLTVTANTAQRSGMDQLRRVATALWVDGAEPRFAGLQTGEPTAGAAPAATAPAPAPARRGPMVPLALGAPLVRLGPGVALGTRPGAAAPAAAAAAVDPAPAADPVSTQFRAVLADATEAASDVLAATRHVTQPTPERPDRGLTLSLQRHPELRDHCLARRPAGWTDDADLYPIVPMTTLLAMMSDAAAERATAEPTGSAGGGRVVVGVRAMHALRPLPVAPPVTVTVRATATERDPDGTEAVSMVIDDAAEGGAYARATVLLADHHRAAPEPDDPPLRGQRPTDVDAATMYAERWMFHGPAYQGVSELGPIGEDGIRGVLTALPAPGALLDAAGQLLGYWVATDRRNHLVLPATIDAIDFHAPAPEPGARLRCVVRVRSVSERDAVADLDLVAAEDGRPFCRITGWADRRLQTDDAITAVFRFPERSRLSVDQPGGWVLLHAAWTDPTTTDLIARQYLNAAERETRAHRNPRAARQWLHGRIAVKDAIRSLLGTDRSSEGGRPRFPAEIEVRNDPDGRPYVVGSPGSAPVVSLAHSGPLAAAIARPAAAAPHGVGIDIELVSDNPAEAALLTDTERTLLDRLGPEPGADRSGWVTRFWTAKEAVAKARGTGLAGRPGNFIVEQVDGDTLLVRTGEIRTHVSTRLGDDPVRHAVGWTLDG